MLANKRTALDPGQVAVWDEPERPRLAVASDHGRWYDCRCQAVALRRDLGLH